MLILLVISDYGEVRDMLLGYGAKNCWCFKDWLDIDLRLNGYASQEKLRKLDYTQILGFEGANASGKTHALKIYAFITDFVTNSFNYSTNGEILFDTFFFNEDPSEFYVEFKTSDGTEYRYEALLTKKKVLTEKVLLIKSSGKEELIIDRNGNFVATKILPDNITGSIIYKDNASCISTLHQYGLKEINSIYSFFENTYINVTYLGFRYEIRNDVPNISKMYNMFPDVLNFTKTLIKKFDTGVTDISISKVENEKGESTFFPVYTHDNFPNRKLRSFNESTGTETLFVRLYYYCKALMSGGVLIQDEFDINLHPDIQPHLLKLFTDEKTNPKGAQLIFTSLNPDILDSLGKYRTYLFEKDSGESFAYRLDEPKTNILRNDRSISAPYKRHMIGGYPRIEA